LISYPDLASSSNKSTYAIGKPLTITNLYHFTGVDPKTGLYTFQDINNDGVIDYQFTEPVTQKYFGGFENNLSYKGFHIDIFFQFVKQTGYNYFAIIKRPGYYNFNQPVYVLDRWRKTGDVANVGRAFRGSGDGQNAYNNAANSDYKIGDASFIRLK